MQLQWISRFLTVWGTVFNSDDKNSYSQLEVSQWYNYQSSEIVQGWKKLRLETYFLEGAVWNRFLQAHGELVRDIKWWGLKFGGCFGNSVFGLASCSWLLGENWLLKARGVSGSSGVAHLVCKVQRVSIEGSQSPAPKLAHLNHPF